jgi:hypothetical protein
MKMQYTKLNNDEKLLALKLKYYDDQQWSPTTGDYYTSSRNDLELYQIVNEDNDYFYTNYCDPDKKTETPSSWLKSEFTTVGFGLKRVHVPEWILNRPLSKKILVSMCIAEANALDGQDCGCIDGCKYLK